MDKILKKVKIGKKHEHDQMTTIKKVLELDTIKNTSEYCHYDYTGKKDDCRYWIELKQRNIKYKQYNTIIINRCKLDKFREGLRRGYRCFIFYLLQDGLYQVEIDKRNVDTYDVRYLREQQHETDYVPKIAEIPMDDLRCVHT